MRRGAASARAALGYTARLRVGPAASIRQVVCQGWRSPGATAQNAAQTSPQALLAQGSSHLGKLAGGQKITAPVTGQECGDGPASNHPGCPAERRGPSLLEALPTESITRRGRRASVASSPAPGSRGAAAAPAKPCAARGALAGRSPARPLGIILRLKAVKLGKTPAPKLRPILHPPSPCSLLLVTFSIHPWAAENIGQPSPRSKGTHSVL